MRGSTSAVAFACLVALTNAQSDPTGSARGVVSRVFGEAILNQMSFEAIPADPETNHDVFEIDYDGASKLVIVRGNT